MPALDHERNWMPGLQCKLRMVTEIFYMKWFLCKTANKYCTKASLLSAVSFFLFIFHATAILSVIVYVYINL
jgi:hypothetical protein